MLRVQILDLKVSYALLRAHFSRGLPTFSAPHFA